MTPDATITVDRAHYDLIVENNRDIKHLCRAVDALTVKVDDLSDRLTKCPCPAVEELHEDVETLQKDTADLKGKFAVIVSALGIVGGWIGSLLPGIVGGR